MIAKVGNMRDQTGILFFGCKEFAYCSECGYEMFANKGDYWNLPDSHVLKCCGKPMQLVTKHVVFKPWKGVEA